jgi:hypothetical protein
VQPFAPLLAITVPVGVLIALSSSYRRNRNDPLLNRVAAHVLAGCPVQRAEQGLTLVVES